jgi:hypothetical protein
MVVMAVVVLLVAILGARYGLKKFVSNYTSPTPAAMPVVRYTPAELTALTNRWQAFTVEADKQTNEVTLSLSAQDINTLIDALPDLQQFRDHIRFEIHTNVIKSQISVPLDELKVDAVKGRYLNGRADVKVKIVNGRLDLRLEGMEVNGVKASGAFLTQLQNENLAKDMKASPEAERILKRAESLTVENGQVILRLKPLTQPSGASSVTTNALNP